MYMHSDHSVDIFFNFGCYCVSFTVFFFFKHKTAYEMRIRDWSSDVCSSDLIDFAFASPHKQLAELVYTPIFEDRFGVLCNSAHRYARGKRPLRWQELATSDFVAFTDDTGIGSFLRATAPRAELAQGTRSEA